MLFWRIPLNDCIGYVRFHVSKFLPLSYYLEKMKINRLDFYV